MAVDTYKSKDDKLIEKRWNEKYAKRVQELLDIISEANVFKQDLTTSVEGVVFPKNKWIINDMTVESELRRVCSIEADDAEVLMFTLKPKDYKRVIAACEQRRAALIQQQTKKHQRTR